MEAVTLDDYPCITFLKSLWSICNDENILKVWSTYRLNISFLEVCYYPSKYYELNFVTGMFVSNICHIDELRWMMS